MAPAASTIDLLDTAAKVASWARAGEQVEASLGRSTSTAVRAQGGEVESVKQATQLGCTVRVVVDGRQGVATTTVLDDAALAECLADARDNASFATPDEHNGLAAPDGVAAATDLDLWRQPGRDLERMAALAVELERRALGHDPRMRGVRTAMCTEAGTERAVATSTGIAAAVRRSSASLGVYAMAGTGDETATGGGSSSGRSLDDLDLERAALECADRAVAKLGATKPESTTLTVVLDPAATPTFLGLLASLASADAVQKGRSIFAGRVGDLVASPLVTLIDDPLDAGAMGAAPFDGEGLACRRNVIIDAGVLAGYLHTSVTGRRDGVASTASSVGAGVPAVGTRAVALRSSVTTVPAAIVAGIDHGILVDALIGVHSGVSTVSGDLSIGVTGRMIRGGQLAEPVKECTIASTLQRVLLDVVAVGDDHEWRDGGAASVTVAIAGMRLGGR